MEQRTWEQQCDDAANARIAEAEAWGEFTRQVKAGGEITVTREQLGLPNDADLGQIALMIRDFDVWFAQTGIPERTREQVCVIASSDQDDTSDDVGGIMADLPAANAAA